MHGFGNARAIAAVVRTRNVTQVPVSSQFKNNHSTEMCSGSEAGSYLRLVDSCITRLEAQGPSRTCNASKEEEEEEFGNARAIAAVVRTRNVTQVSTVT